MKQKRTERRPAAIRHREEQARAEARADEWMTSIVGPMRTDAADRVIRAVLPANEISTSKLPDRRRRRLTDHLRELIEGIGTKTGTPHPLDGDARSRPDAHDASPRLEHACATCRGHCCRTGGEHAYLDSLVLRRFWSTRPKATGESIVGAYLAALPKRSYAGSCVFHGAAGCALPRSMRADICNDFLCDGAQALKAKLADDPARRAFLVAASHGKPVRATLVEADGSARRIRKR